MTKRRSLCHGLAGALLAAAAAVTPLSAVGGDIPIYHATSITLPGRYVVTRDFAVPGDAIVIRTGGVTLDLNGHTIQPGSGSGVVIDLLSVPPDPGITVINGRIVGGEVGIKGVNLPAVIPILVDKVGIVMPMFYCIDMPGNARLRVGDSVLTQCGRDGIHMSGNGTGLIQIDDTFITDVQGSGIFANAVDGVVVRSTTIRRFGLDTASDSGGVRLVAPGKVGLSVFDSVLCDGSVRGAGLLLEMAGSTAPVSITGCQISGNGLSGIDLRQGTARITGNTISANLAEGLRVDAAGIVTPTMISGNSILDNVLNGANILGGVARFNGNTVGGNLLDGLRVSGQRALVESNFFEGNGGAGLRFLNGTGHAYRSNFLRGNTGGDVQDLFNNTDAGGNIK